MQKRQKAPVWVSSPYAHAIDRYARLFIGLHQVVLYGDDCSDKAVVAFIGLTSQGGVYFAIHKDETAACYVVITLIEFASLFLSRCLSKKGFAVISRVDQTIYDIYGGGDDPVQIDLDAKSQSRPHDIKLFCNLRRRKIYLSFEEDDFITGSGDRKRDIPNPMVVFDMTDIMRSSLGSHIQRIVELSALRTIFNELKISDDLE